MKPLPFLLTLVLCATTGYAQPCDASSDLDSLLEAERAFSKLSLTQGMHQAFLTYLADDAVIFRPRPVEGKKWYAERGETPGTLTWWPIFAEVSRAGDLGYTTGPWDFTKEDDESIEYGHYVSVWRKQPGGSWRVVIDVGIVHSKPQTEAIIAFSPEKVPAVNSGDTAYVDVEAERAKLLKVDREFARHSISKGIVDAFLAYSTDDVRFYRMNVLPTIGKKALRAALSKRPGLLIWESMAAQVSQSGDLGYTYGISKFRADASKGLAAESASYMRIWKKQLDGAWKFVLEIANPIPAAAIESDH
jgi:ketosteroid isomerase-like protein